MTLSFYEAGNRMNVKQDSQPLTFYCYYSHQIWLNEGHLLASMGGPVDHKQCYTVTTPVEIIAA